MSTEANCNPVAHGTPCWSYIPAYSVPRAQKFYSTLFNWTYRTESDPKAAEKFVHINLPDARMGTMGVGGGIMKVKEAEEIFTPFARHGGMAGAKEGEGKVVSAITYLWVDSVDDILAKVEAAGGKVLVPKEKEGESGEHATVEDTEGNAVGVFAMPNLKR
jgi:predicted enzyme related to lactoylglutathione lyase